MSSEPLISVVIPVHNGERYLGDCLRSVLRQTYEHLEIVLADNASTDRTAEIIDACADPRMRRLSVPLDVLSLHANWERAVAAAQGEFVKLVCHDDLLSPECVAVQAKMLLAHPDAVLASNRRRIVDDRGNVLIRARGLGPLLGPEGSREVASSEIVRACVRAGTNLLGEPASVLIRRCSLPEPIFDPRWHYAIDLDLYLRCLRRGGGVVDHASLSSFRVSPYQWSATLDRRQSTEMRAFFGDIASRYPDYLRPFDLHVAGARAAVHARARRGMYGLMRARSAAGTWRRALRPVQANAE